MRYRKPEELKESGIEWVSQIPRDWNIKRIKYLLSERKERSKDGSEELLSVSEYFGVKPRREVIDENEHLSRSESLEGYKICYSGDLVMNIMLAWKKGLGVTKYDGIVSPAYSVFEFKENLEPRYYNYLFRSEWYIDTFKRFSRGIIDSRLRLYPDVFGGIYSHIPPKTEQRAIATFLDRKTEAIDQLIQKKEQLIERLKEKRQALITRAVTKGLPSEASAKAGLDPSVPMKDSGIEWLGEIPEDWKTLKVKQVLKFRDNERIPVNSSDRGKMTEKKYPYYGASGIIDYVEDYLFDEKLLLVAEDGANLYSRSSPLAFSAEGKYWVNNHAHILEPRYGPLEFWEYYLQIVVYDPWITGAAQPKLTKDNLGSIPVPYPPKSKREKITKFLSDEDEKINQNVELINTQIEKFKEYRQSLISAAVTGKIDVRDEIEIKPNEVMA